ncbi:hypothetical protein [Intrasporangium sp.]|uniref:hypothetical protein n=1 Tax=Intrasporangium sp. TaxID=1925024 RepID=UPI00293B119D|nr:hypothetical protein [Intrasporangium sp.]MDV3222141.1 hypothetical protein [Intrasporangium sp.]
MNVARRAAAVVSALAIVGGTGWSAASKAGDDRGADLTAVAIASAADPAATDDAFGVARLGSGRGVSADASAGADTNCDGCTSSASVMSVVYVNHSRTVEVDNLATSATTGCTDCSSEAVSLQVVVLRRTQTVVANNRSLAVNAVCESCTSSAVAHQIVVVAPRGGQLSAKDLAALREWVRGQGPASSSAARSAPEPSAKSSARSPSTSSPGSPAKQELEQHLRHALGPLTTLSYKEDVDIR